MPHQEHHVAEATTPRVLTVLSSDGARPPHVDRLESAMEVRYTDSAGLAEALAGSHALLAWDSLGALADAWAGADSLEWVHAAAAGVDALLFPALVESSVVVTHARGIFDRPIAEFVLGSVLAFAKRSKETYELQQRREWRPRQTDVVAGSTALVVGTGSIGREIARVLRAVGVEVRGAGRTARSGDPDFGDVIASAELAQHVAWADHLVVVAPLTPMTRGLIGEAVLSAMRPESHLINVGRGPIVDESALLAALESGGIAGASLDVFATEPLPTEDPLWTAPGVTITPHMSGDAAGWEERLAQQFLENAQRWLAGESLENVVDKELGFAAARPRT